MRELHGQKFFQQGGFRWKSYALDACISADQKTLHSFHYDGSYVQWDIETGAVLEARTFTLSENRWIHQGVLLGSPPTHALLSTYSDGMLLELQTMQVVRSAPTQSRAHKLCHSADRSLVFSEAFRFDASTQQFSTHKLPEFSTFALSCDNEFFLCQHYREQHCSVVRLRDGIVCEVREDLGRFDAAVFSADNKHLYLCTEKALRCFSFDRTEERASIGKEQWNLPLDQGGSSLFFHAGELYLFSQMKFWVLDPSNGTVLRTFPSPTDGVIHRDDSDLFLVGYGQPFLRGNFRTGTVEDRLSSEEGYAEGLALSPSEQLLAWSTNSAVLVADPKTGTILNSFECEDSSGELAFFSEEQHLCLEGGIYEWNTGSRVCSFYQWKQDQGRLLNSFAVAPDSSLFAWTTYNSDDSEDQTSIVSLRDLHSEHTLWETKIPLRYARVHFASNGKHLLCRDYSRQLLLDQNTGAILERIDDVGGFLDATCGDFAFVLMRDYDQPNPNERQEYTVYRGMERTPVHNFRTSEDTTLSPYTNREFTERKLLWWKNHESVATLLHEGETVATLHIDPSDSFYCAVFSKDERTLFVGTGKGEIYRFDLSSFG